MTNQPLLENHAKKSGRGLPEKVKVLEVLKVLPWEKKSVPITIKIQPSLAGVLKELGPSYVREAIIERLEREIEE